MPIGRMDLEPILSVKMPVIIGSVLNFYGEGHSDSVCKQTFTHSVIRNRRKNKKVLLPETARGIPTTAYTPSWPGQGVPHPCPASGHPIMTCQVPPPPHPNLHQGVPHLDLAGVLPLHSDLTGVPLGRGMGPVEVLWDGENITFSHPLDAIGNKTAFH